MFLDEIPAAIPHAALKQRGEARPETEPSTQSVANVAASGAPVADEPTAAIGRRRDVTGKAPSRTVETVRQYGKTLDSLIKQACAMPAFDHSERLHATCLWFSVQHGSWKPTTIRKYRAALIWAVEIAAEGGLLEDSPEELLGLLKPGPDRRSNAAPARTSAKKRKDLPLADFQAVSAYLASGTTASSRLLAGVISFAVLLGLRPIEFFTASVVGDRLIVRCAKNTNGRALGPVRVIDLGFTPGQIAKLDETLRLLRQAVREADFMETVMERLSKTLYRACKMLGIAPISLYTCRHQFIANSKGSMTRLEIAALVGHVSVDTASRHYGRRTSGWGSKPICSPSPDSIKAVNYKSGRGLALEMLNEKNCSFAGRSNAVRITSNI